MSRYDVTMEIYGRLETRHEVETLAIAIAAAEVSPGWGDGRLGDPEDAADHVLGSARSGRPLRLVRGDTGMEMEEIAAACRQLDFAYRIRFDDPDGSPVRQLAWESRFSKVHETDRVGTDGVLIRASVVDEAFRRSAEEGFSLLERTLRGDLPGIDREFTVDRILADEIEETLFADGASPAP